MTSRRTRQSRKRRALAAALSICVIFGAIGCSFTIGDQPSSGTGSTNAATSASASITAANPEEHLGSLLIADAIPDFSGQSYIEIDGNTPNFTEEDLAVPTGTEIYGELDSLGRCTGAFALVGPETQPTAKRGNISDIKPSGWKQNLDLYSLGIEHLYERSHLIAHKLTGEDANRQNLITGTFYLNQGAMSKFETIVDDYVDRTGGHVLMRVTPIFSGDELVARGVQMEAYSVEDAGESVSFNVYCYNVQPGVEIDYSTGASHLSE